VFAKPVVTRGRNPDSRHGIRPGSLASDHPRNTHGPELDRARIGDLTAATIVAGSNKVWWRCRVAQDHMWQAMVSSRTFGGNGYQACSGHQRSATNSPAVRLNSAGVRMANANMSPTRLQRWSAKPRQPTKAVRRKGSGSPPKADRTLYSPAYLKKPDPSELRIHCIENVDCRV
jgi:hypothetical protein